MVYAVLMTKGGQQVPQPKSKAKAPARSREMMSEGVEQTPDVSPPRLQPERPPIVLREGRNVGTLDCSPKSANITEKSTAEYWGAFAGMTIFFYMESVHVFFFCAEKFCMALCARMTRTYCVFWKKSSMAPFFVMTRQGFEALGMTPVQG